MKLLTWICRDIFNWHSLSLDAISYVWKKYSVEAFQYLSIQTVMSFYYLDVLIKFVARVRIWSLCLFLLVMMVIIITGVFTCGRVLDCARIGTSGTASCAGPDLPVALPISQCKPVQQIATTAATWTTQLWNCKVQGTDRYSTTLLQPRRWLNASLICSSYQCKLLFSLFSCYFCNTL